MDVYRVSESVEDDHVAGFHESSHPECRLCKSLRPCTGCDTEKGACDYWKRQGRAACCPDCKHPDEVK